MVTGSGYISRGLQSLFYFLNNVQYQSSGTAKTLKQTYTGLNIGIDFPDSLEALHCPAISLVSNPTPKQAVTYASLLKGVPLSFSIYGFAGGKQTDGDNKNLRDNLCNDIREVLEDTDYITLYDYPDYVNTKGDMSIESVESRFIEPTGITTADKFRFVIDIECEYFK